ncbi:MAG TPA: tRNA (adenosine(37)-N6)-threonylcarbamoyltransferase complex ATPase subunit type 1 TsaE [Thermoanaerobaculia bacterium]|nr:tRNA (adenosine(37)-N6)-threonylcarbamoyltransferase complex ATPase subunit type 1 TsaE [Thermoanaerobaculia bacterium]
MTPAALKRVVVSRSEEETRAAGAALARDLGAGAAVLLHGDLGSGKTVFVRGLAEGLGADPSEVASPTFALVHEYGPDGAPPVLVHADLYRLAGDDGVPAPDLGLDEARAAGSVVAIEWPRPPFTELAAWRVSLRERADGSREIVISRS